MVQKATADNIEAHIQGEISGQIVVGNHNVQIHAEHGALVNFIADGKLPVPRPRPAPILSLRPRRFLGLLDRQTETASAISALMSEVSAEVYGEAGMGKTSLLRHLAYHPDTNRFPDGVIYGPALNQPVADLLQFLFEAFYESDVPFKPSDTQIRHFLGGRHALVLLDDVKTTREEIEVLMNTVPSCVFVLASAERHLWGDVQAIAIGGLPSDDAVALVEREMGHSLSPQEREAARALCAALDFHPLRVLQETALAREEHRSLLEVAQLARATPGPEERTRQVLASRSNSERLILGLLAALGSASANAEHLAALAKLPDVDGVLQTLLQLNLVQVQESRYRLAGDVAKVLAQNSDLAPLKERALTYYADWAEQTVTSPDRLLEEADAIQHLMEWGLANNHLKNVQRLGHAVEGALTLSGRWEAWRRVVEHMLKASRELGDKAGEAWAIHQLGTRALCLTDNSAAYTYLSQALDMRESLGDQIGAAVTRHNLNLLLTPSPPSEESSDPRGMAGAKSSTLLRGALLSGIFLALVGLLTWLLWPKPAPSLSISVNRLDFPDQRVGSKSDPRTVTFTNKGSEPLIIQSVTLVGSDAEHFVIASQDCAGAPLAPGRDCAIGVVFTPRATGNRSVKLQITDNAADSPQVVTLTGVGTLAVVSSSPESLDFGDQEVGTQSKEQNLALTNSGSTPLKISKITPAGANANDFSIYTDCVDAPLGPGRSCVIKVIFTPSSDGKNEASLDITDELGAGLRSVTLTGAGTAPLISFSQSNLDFSNQEIGVRTEPQAITLTNRGSAPLRISKVALGGANAASFQITADECSRASIEPGGDCALRINFTPRRVGGHNATLTVNNNSSDKTHNLRLTGVGVTPIASLSHNSLDFSNQVIRGPGSEPQSVVITNRGSAPLRMDGIRLTGADDFSITANGCARAAIAPGDSCAISVKFVPKALGRRSASLSFTNNAADSPQSVQLIGTGVTPPRPEPAYSPRSLDFGTQEVNSASAPQSVSITNRGQGILAIRNLSITGANADDFKIVGETCTSNTVGPGGSCSISLAFTPRNQGVPAGRRAVPGERVSPGTSNKVGRSARLSIATNAADSPQDISLVGRVAGPPRRASATLSPTSLRFGSQEVGTESRTQPVTLTNTGDASMEVNDVSLGGAGDFNIAEDNCVRATVNPGGSCTVSVRFAPAESGSHKGTLNINHNAASGSRIVSLSGNGVEIAKETKNGYCCSEGKLKKSTEDECSNRGGSFFENKGEAEERCQPEKGWCCKLGRLYQTTEEECRKVSKLGPLKVGQAGYFSLNKKEVEGRCERPPAQVVGGCCVNGKFATATEEDCKSRGGIFSLNSQELRRRCVPETGTEAGYCCAGGRVFSASQDACKQREGAFYKSEREARLNCSSPPQQEEGWCCNDGQVFRSSRQKCVQVRGSYFDLERRARKRCALQ